MSGDVPGQETAGLSEVPDRVALAPIEPTPLDEDTSEPDHALDGASLLAEVAELDEDGPPA